MDKSDASEIVAEIIAVKPKSMFFGCLLKLPLRDVEGIISEYPHPHDHFVNIINKFLMQEEFTPTWRFILDTLRNPLINSSALAEQIEKRYNFPPSGNSCYIIPIGYLCCLSLYFEAPIDPPTIQQSCKFHLYLCHF